MQHCVTDVFFPAILNALSVFIYKVWELQEEYQMQGTGVDV
jgi:hypothetical protein